ncbi:SLAP domain-containing protein [Companilactobacillus insicii]|uniref:SLAP domain-containing protein n=1 Tax=Companilactobacillus insicii TaxID=1732567 RepID=UPI000F795871|nr:SLAP domain-containing protein [Companilactobacillus insicii]
MKKSLIVSGLLFSSMILGSVATPAVVQAADDNTVTESATTSDSTKTGQISNNVTFKDPDNKTLVTMTMYGKVGENLTVPQGSDALKGYYFNGAVPVFQADGSSYSVTVTKAGNYDNVATLNVSYYAGDKTNIVGTEQVSGPKNTVKKLSSIPSGYKLANAADVNVNLGKETTNSVSIEVIRPVANTIIFKTAENQQVGTTTVSGEKVGDSVAMTDAQIPANYTVTNKNVTLQADGNTQIVTATKADASGITSYKTVGTTGEFGARIYRQDGTLIKGRGLGSKTAWSIDKKLVLNGVTYYRVATNEFVKAADVTLSGVEDGSNTDNNGSETTVTTPTDAVKADRAVVTTTSDDPTYLYKGNGQKISNRALLPHSAWQTSKMATINGVKMYKVATDEWVPATDIK